VIALATVAYQGNSYAGALVVVVFLVGGFASVAWDSHVLRKIRRERNELEEAKERFADEGVRLARLYDSGKCTACAEPRIAAAVLGKSS
jgi:hypothetical protein